MKQPVVSKLTYWAEYICEFSFLSAVFVLPFSKALLEVFLTISFISWFLLKLFSKGNLLKNKAILAVAVLLFISSSISAFGFEHPHIVIHGLFKLLRYTLIFLTAYDFFNSSLRIRRLIWVALISFYFLAVDSLIQMALGQDLVNHISIKFTDTQLRATGPFTSYGLLASFLIGILPIIVALTFDKNLNSLRKILLSALAMLGFYLLYKTYSRGAWLAAITSWYIFGLLTKKRILLILLTVILIAVPLTMPRNAIIHLDMHKKEQSLIERFYLWDRAIQVIKAKPLFGCGINTYTYDYQKFDKTKSWRVPGYYAHNGYLQLAAETGLVSLFLFFIILGSGLQSGYLAFKKSKDDKKLLLAGLISGFAALLLQAAVDTTLHNLQSAVLIWLFLGLMFASKDLAKKGKYA